MRWMSAAPLAVLVLALGCPADSSFTNIEVVENPNNALSCIVRFTAAESGPGAVEFGAGDDPAFAVRDRLKDVDHELVVIGMRPETTYKLWLVSTPDFSPEARSEPIEYTTGAVPFDDLVLEQTAYVAAEMQPGWTLTNVSVGSNMYPATAVILDQEGVPVWYHRMSDTPGRADVDVRMCGDETICIGGSLASFDPPVELDLAGNPVWTGPAQPDVTNLMTPGEMHHHFTRMDDGGYQILRLQVEDGWAYDEVEELDEAGEVVWSWHGEGDLVGKGFDYPWGNSIETDLDQGLLYYNARNHSTLYAIDRDTGETVWALGRDGDFTFLGDDDHTWPIQPHAPEIQPDGNVLMYDNGSHMRGFSRVVEYVVDYDAMTADIAWEYPGTIAEDDWFDFSLGDADRQPNGNTLVTATSLLEEDSQSRIFEVTAEGQKVWEVTMREAGGEPAAAYAAERIPVLVEQLD